MRRRRFPDLHPASPVCLQAAWRVYLIRALVIPHRGGWGSSGVAGRYDNVGMRQVNGVR